MKSKPVKKHYCRHCGKPYDTYYMAEICFSLDMKILQAEKKVLVKKEHI